MFNHPAIAQHVDIVAHLGHDAHVVSDQNNRDIVLLCELLQRVQNRLLHRYVQGGCWLIRDYQIRPRTNRDGEDNTLTQTARQLVWIFGQAILGQRYFCLLQQFDRIGTRSVSGFLGVSLNRFNQLLADGQHRI